MGESSKYRRRSWLARDCRFPFPGFLGFSNNGRRTERCVLRKGKSEAMKLLLSIGAAVLLLATVAAQQTPPIVPDIPAKFEAPTSSWDYVKREAMIPMRDGVHLYTVIVVPKGSRNA